MFEKGDFVRVKPETEIDTGETITDWAGEVFQVFPEEEVCTVVFDAPAIDAFSDHYIKTVSEAGGSLLEYNFSFSELELGERRETDEKQRLAIDRLIERELMLEVDANEAAFWKHKEEWPAAFAESPFSGQLGDVEREHASFVADIFMDFMYNYELVTPDEWQPVDVRAVYLETLPQKLHTDDETFKLFGTVLIAFLRYLGDAGHIDNAASLIKTVDQIKDQIPVNAKDPNRWGITKGLLKGKGHHDASSFGIDPTATYRNDRPVPPDPFKGIGHNQKITVQYEDGTTKADIKFKKVEKDLRAGRCELIKR